jgi:hypothetical protein
MKLFHLLLVELLSDEYSHFKDKWKLVERGTSNGSRCVAPHNLLEEMLFSMLCHKEIKGSLEIRNIAKLDWVSKVPSILENRKKMKAAIQVEKGSMSFLGSRGDCKENKESTMD